jgi:alpha-galactosidase
MKVPVGDSIEPGKRFRGGRSLLFLVWGALLLNVVMAVARDRNGDDALRVAIDAKSGSYSIYSAAISGAVLSASPAIQVGERWVATKDYPHCEVSSAKVSGVLGDAEEWTMHCSGNDQEPDLLLHVRTYAAVPFGEIEVTTRNSTGRPARIQGFRLAQAEGPEVIRLGGDPSSDRVLLEGFSEDRPPDQVRDLNRAEKGAHRAVGGQLIYNRQSGMSWFAGALSTEKFLTLFRLKMAGETTSTTRGFEIDSTGTTEVMAEYSLKNSPSEDRIQLSLPLPPGGELNSERILFSVSRDYHNQLETYGRMVRDLHHARVDAPTPMGWWSWTAYYSGLHQGAALTNAEWLAQQLKPLGYKFFHIDEGYSYARGEYLTADANAFPDGLAAFEHRVLQLGLTPGLWTAPFEVSERAWVYQKHPEWLVHNAKGGPIHLGNAGGGKDQLYAIDATHPGAREYLRETYQSIARDWGVRYIKLDFMDDTLVEGVRYQPDVTALEAQRIGLKIIRDAVGAGVLLDKDGSDMLNTVGLTDMGRTSQDTGHTFAASREAATGIAARYYMHRNFYLADPDAFTVSRQTLPDQGWHNSKVPLTLNEAKVSIALATISGGMFEIGDDLPTLGKDADRLALVRNTDLIEMAELGRASVPLDLMTYAPEDELPSIFFLHESKRQSILTIFNWTEAARSHQLSGKDLGLDPACNYEITELLEPGSATQKLGEAIKAQQPAHSVRMFRLVNGCVKPMPPAFSASVIDTAKAGESTRFRAEAVDAGIPVLRWQWDFGDGVSDEGASVEHTYTSAGQYKVRLRAVGIGGSTAEKEFTIAISGSIPTRFAPALKQRPAEQETPQGESSVQCNCRLCQLLSAQSAGATMTPAVGVVIAFLDGWSKQQNSIGPCLKPRQTNSSSTLRCLVLL